MSREMVLSIICLVVAVILFVFTVCSYFKDAKIETIRRDAYTLFLRAENMFKGSKRGQEKMNWVIKQIHDIIPNWLRFFVGEEELKEMLQVWFDCIKDLLDDGKYNKSTRSNK